MTIRICGTSLDRRPSQQQGGEDDRLIAALQEMQQGDSTIRGTIIRAAIERIIELARRSPAQPDEPHECADTDDMRRARDILDVATNEDVLAYLHATENCTCDLSPSTEQTTPQSDGAEKVFQEHARQYVARIQERGPRGRRIGECAINGCYDQDEGHTDDCIEKALRSGFDAGRASRDPEVRELADLGKQLFEMGRESRDSEVAELRETIREYQRARDRR